MIEDLIDFIEIHPIVAFEAIYEPMLTSFWTLISFVVQLYIIMQYKGQHPPLLPKMPFCLLYLPPKLVCIHQNFLHVYTQTWIQVFLIQVFLNGDLDAKLVSCIPGLRTYRFAFLYYYQTQRDYLHSKRKKLNLAKYAFLNSSRNSFNCIQYLC